MKRVVADFLVFEIVLHKKLADNNLLRRDGLQSVFTVIDNKKIVDSIGFDTN